MRRIKPMTEDASFTIVKSHYALLQDDVKALIRSFDDEIFERYMTIVGQLYMNGYHDAGMELMAMSDEDITTYLMMVLGEED